LLEHHDLSDDPSGHDESRHCRREDALVAACEDQHSGDERTPSDANRQEKGGNRVIAERRVLEPFQRELSSPSRFYQDAVLLGAEQQDYATPDSRQRVKRFRHTDCDTDQCVLHLLAPFVEMAVTVLPQFPASAPPSHVSCSFPAGRVSSRS
jgi:hypothetical protein